MNFKRLFYLAKCGQIDPVRYHVSDEKKIVYIENPKVACTSIKTIIYPDLRDMGMELHEEADKRSVISIRKIPRDYVFFSVVRDPADRLSSCYRDKVENRHITGHVLGFKLYKFIYFLYGKSYRTLIRNEIGFLETVSIIPDQLSDRHVKTQSCLFGKVLEDSRPLSIMKIEEIGEAWKDFSDKHSLPKLPVRNDTNKVVSTAGSFNKEQLLSTKYAKDYFGMGY